jgi:coiled-coil domain-containing protein 12
MRAQVQTKAEIQLDVAPKKANWDLKQHIAKKLEKLERRTQQAIVELIKEKVSQDGDAEEQGRLLAAGVRGKA